MPGTFYYSAGNTVASNGQEILDAIKLGNSNVDKDSDPFIEALQIFSDLPAEATVSGQEIKNLVLKNIPPDKLAKVSSDQLGLLDKINQISKNGSDIYVDFTQPFETKMIDNKGAITNLKIRSDMKIKIIKNTDESSVTLEFLKDKSEPWALWAKNGLIGGDIKGFKIDKNQNEPLVVTAIATKWGLDIPIQIYPEEKKN